jgi:hypothetical protein
LATVLRRMKLLNLQYLLSAPQKKIDAVTEVVRMIALSWPQPSIHR